MGYDRLLECKKCVIQCKVDNQWFYTENNSLNQERQQIICIAMFYTSKHVYIFFFKYDKTRKL